MATSTIGTAGRNYSTIQAWEDSLLAVLLAPEVGECYNDSEFVTANEVVTFSGSTTSASNTITLKCAAGQSFRDNANKLTNALRYNASNGVALRRTNNYNQVIDINETNVFLDGLQIQGIGGSAVIGVTGRTGVLTNCIVESTNYSISLTGGGKVKNSLLVVRSTASVSAIVFSYPTAASLAMNCTLVRPSNFTAASSAITKNANAATMINCAGFGFTNFCSNNTAAVGSNNCSDATIGFGTSNQASKTYSNQFENSADSTRDFRLKSGTDCFNNGVTDTTNLPAADDIVGTARPQSTNWDISCWELTVVSSFLARNPVVISQALKRAAYW